eukprot:80543-Rhodomonas_salina.2
MGNGKGRYFQSQTAHSKRVGDHGAYHQRHAHVRCRQERKEHFRVLLAQTVVEVVQNLLHTHAARVSVSPATLCARATLLQAKREVDQALGRRRL